MIKFFRSLRYNFISNNRFSKYLVYAFGEIVLVMIGILIALQINNWNELRKESKEEIAILENLEKNLVLAMKQSELLVSEEKKLKQRLIVVLGIDSINSKVKLEDMTDPIFKNAFWNLESGVPVINAYTDLKNTNKLGLIKNQGIKEKFTSLEVKLNELQSMLDDRLNVQQIRIDNIAENEINFIPLIKSSIPTIEISEEQPNDYRVILNDRRIRNLLGIKLNMTQDVLDYRINLDKEIAELKLSIESELNQRSL